MVQAEWIAVDWGTTRLRAWAMSGRDMRAQASSEHGMNTLTSEQFEPALLTLVQDWLRPVGTTQVICCGMVGSRQGWVEAAYRSVPCPASADTLTPAPVHDPRLKVDVLSGLSQHMPPDVMRGEETQISGFLALNPGWDGVICLPGTHTKWVHVSASEVVSFQTFMTGEVFGLLENQSVLRHSIDSDAWNADAFAAAVSDGMSKPEALAAQFFRLRAAQLLNGTDGAITHARLSGLLIGAELAAARPYWLGQQVAVVGADALASAYVSALAAQGIAAIRTDADAATRAGLTAAYRALEPAT